MSIHLIKEKVSLKDVVSQHINLTYQKNRWVGCCPFHQEKTPSFFIAEDDKFYYCFGCHAKGDVFTFLMDFNKKTFFEVLHDLCDKYGIVLDHLTHNNDHSLYRLHEEVSQFYERQLTFNQQALNYLSKRGIQQDTIKKFRLGFAPKGVNLHQYLLELKFSKKNLEESGIFKDQYDRFSGRIQIPICDSKGRVIAFGGRLMNDHPYQPKYLNSSATAIFSKKDTLFAYHHGRKYFKDKAPIVVEGYFDVMMLHQQGMTTAVAPLGTALSIEHLKTLWSQHPSPVFCFDGDMAGKNASFKGATLMTPCVKAHQMAEFCVLPSGEDPDSLCRKDQFQSILNQKKSFFHFVFDHYFEGQDIQKMTVEKRALALKLIMDHFDKIEDRLLKQQFQQETKKVFFNCLFAKSDQKKTTSKDPLPLPCSEKALLASLIIHPHMIEDLLEDITILDFKDHVLNDLKMKILDAYMDKGPQGLERSHLLDGELKYYGYIAQKNHDDLKSMWNSYIQKNSVSTDLNRVMQCYRDAPTLKEWEKIVYLKKMEALK
jgi:DNA primase